MNDYFFTWIMLLFHAVIFDKLSVVDLKHQSTQISYSEELSFFCCLGLRCFQVNRFSYLMSKRNPVERRWRHFMTKKKKGPCIESDNTMLRNLLMKY